MLLFDEMLSKKKIKIYNQYAAYPKIEMLKDNFFNRKIKIHIGKNISPKIEDNDPLYDELKFFLNLSKNIIDKNELINISSGRYILKILFDLYKKN